MFQSRTSFAIVCIGIGFAAAWLLVSGPTLTVNADCPGEPGTPCINGDVNADGDLNISDPVYLLSYLFLGGPAPVPFSCEPCDSCCPSCEPCDSCCPQTCLPPVTGQTLCKDTAGNTIDCNSEEFPGQDGAYRAGCIETDRFVDNGDGTVDDRRTGLMWAKEPADGKRKMTWQQALQYCDRLILCEDGTWTTSEIVAEEHGGVKWDDWRMPNINEFQSLCTRRVHWPASAIDSVFDLPIPEISVASDWVYWTSTTYLHRNHCAWVVFYDGQIAPFVQGNPIGQKTNSYFVLPVRLGR